MFNEQEDKLPDGIRDIKDIPVKKVTLPFDQPDFTPEEATYYIEQQIKSGDMQSEFYDPVYEFVDFVSKPIQWVGKLFNKRKKEIEEIKEIQNAK